MKNSKISYSVIKVISLFLVYSFLLVSAAAAQDLFTQHNIWYEIGKEQKLYCINYKAGVMIPAGTRVTNVEIKETPYARRLNHESVAIFFTTAEDNRSFMVHFTAKWHPGKTIQDYKDFMFGTKNFDQLVQGMSKTEVDAIKQGRLVPGMSKKAVIAAYGHPPEHKTPSLDYNQWRYWTNRFANRAIIFDANGKTYSNSL